MIFRSTGTKEIGAAKRIAADIIKSFWIDSGRSAVRLKLRDDNATVVARQAQRGDKECGYFLSEMLPMFWKTRDGLAKSNETFRIYFPEIESAHFATAKESPLRRMIHQIINQARAERRVLQIAQAIPRSPVPIKPNDRLLALPDLDHSKEAINAWTDGGSVPAAEKNCCEAASSSHHREHEESARSKWEISNFTVEAIDPSNRSSNCGATSALLFRHRMSGLL